MANTGMEEDSQASWQDHPRTLEENLAEQVLKAFTAKNCAYCNALFHDERYTLCAPCWFRLYYG
jgi:hypothetical protein